MDKDVGVGFHIGRKKDKEMKWIIRLVPYGLWRYSNSIRVVISDCILYVQGRGEFRGKLSITEAYSCWEFLKGIRGSSWRK